MIVLVSVLAVLIVNVHVRCGCGSCGVGWLLLGSLISYHKQRQTDDTSRM